jgi:NADPH:quinone reductase-like Zn-dependent oxidoreductase
MSNVLTSEVKSWCVTNAIADQIVSSKHTNASRFEIDGISLVLDMVGGTPVGELAKSLKVGGSIVIYALQSGQLSAISPGDLIYRGLNLHGF